MQMSRSFPESDHGGHRAVWFPVRVSVLERTSKLTGMTRRCGYRLQVRKSDLAGPKPITTSSSSLPDQDGRCSAAAAIRIVRRVTRTDLRSPHQFVEGF